MTKENIKVTIERVLSWPPERQEQAVELLNAIEAQDSSGYHLTDEQLAEIRRRRESGGPTLTLAEFDERLRRLGL